MTSLYASLRARAASRPAMLAPMTRARSTVPVMVSSRWAALGYGGCGWLLQRRDDRAGEATDFGHGNHGEGRLAGGEVGDHRLTGVGTRAHDGFQVLEPQGVQQGPTRRQTEQ